MADISGRLSLKQLERAITAAERQQLLDWVEMDAFLARRHYGTSALREVLGSVDPRAAEPYEGLEELFLSLWSDPSRPDPEPQALVEGIRVDFYWSAAGVIVECDSYRYHGDRIAYDTDHIRTMQLRAAGFDVYRTTHRILTELPDQFIETVQAAITARTRPQSDRAARAAG